MSQSASQINLQQVLGYLSEAYTEPVAPEPREAYLVQSEEGSYSFFDRTDPQNTGYDGLRHLAGNPQDESNPYFAPILVRGCQGFDLGRYYGWYQGDVTSRQALNQAEDALKSAAWSWDVEAPSPYAEVLEARLNTLLPLSGKAWHKHLEEACLYRVFGFVPFVLSKSENSVKPQYRWPSTVDDWLLDPETGELLGIKFLDLSEPVWKEDLVLYQRQAYGTAFEGSSVYRQVGLLIRAKQDLLRISAQAATIHGVGQVVITETQPGVSDATQDQRLLDILSAAVGSDRPVYKLRHGHSLEVLSPNGQIPDFDKMIRYLDEQILSIVQAEGSIIGLNSHGSYALAESKERSALAQAQGVGRLISTTLSDAMARILIDEGWDLTGINLRLCWTWPSPERETPVSDLVALISAGVLDANDPEIVELMRRRVLGQ